MWWTMFIICCWIQFAGISSENIFLNVYKKYWSAGVLSVCSFSGTSHWLRLKRSLRTWQKIRFFPLQFFPLETFKKNCCEFFQHIEFTGETIKSRVFLFSEFTYYSDYYYYCHHYHHHYWLHCCMFFKIWPQIYTTNLPFFASVHAFLPTSTVLSSTYWE